MLREVGSGEHGPRRGWALPALLTHGLALPARKAAACEARLGVVVVGRRLLRLPLLRLTRSKPSQERLWRLGRVCATRHMGTNPQHEQRLNLAASTKYPWGPQRTRNPALSSC